MKLRSFLHGSVFSSLLTLGITLPIAAQVFPNRGHDRLAYDSTTKYAECYLYDTPTALVPENEIFYLNFRRNAGSSGSEFGIGGFIAQRGQIELRFLFEDQNNGGRMAFKMLLWSTENFLLATSFRFGSYFRELSGNKPNAFQDLLLHFSYIGFSELQLCGTTGVSLRSRYAGTTYYPFDLGILYHVVPFVFLKISSRVYPFNPHDLEGYFAASTGVSLLHFYLELGYARTFIDGNDTDSDFILSTGLTF